MSSRTYTADAEQAWNDEQLRAPVTRPSWRIWRHDTPAVVLGHSHEDRAAHVALRDHLPLIRRASGGGAVLVGPWMSSLSVVLPGAHPRAGEGPLPAYHWLGDCLARVLRDGGVDAHASPPDEARRLATGAGDAALTWACFGGVSPWEVVVGTRKVAGLAQVRRRHGVLLTAGLLLYAPDWALLCRALDRPPEDADALAARTTSWAAEAGHRPSGEEVEASLHAALGTLLG